MFDCEVNPRCTLIEFFGGTLGQSVTPKVTQGLSCWLGFGFRANRRFPPQERRSTVFPEMAMDPILWLHLGVDEHPFATYFDVHQDYRVLTHSQMGVHVCLCLCVFLQPKALGLCPDRPQNGFLSDSML